MYGIKSLLNVDATHVPPLNTYNISPPKTITENWIKNKSRFFMTCRLIPLRGVAVIGFDTLFTSILIGNFR